MAPTAASMRGGAGLYLDLDGTLADSLAVMRTVYARFLGHFAKTGSDAEFARLSGPPLARVVAELSAAHQIAVSSEYLTDLYRDLVAEGYGEVEPKAGACELLQAAEAAGLKIGIVTSNTAALARSWLRHVGLDGSIDCVVGGDEVSRGKPDPEPYLLALARTGCAAARSVAVEDTPTGARAAEAAGLRTFMLADGPAHPRDGIVGIRTLRDVIAFLG